MIKAMSDRDRLRTELMQSVRDLPSPSLECVVAVAKSFQDGLEIDDIETGVMRTDVRRKRGIKVEAVRVILRESSTGGIECKMRVAYRLGQDELDFHHDYVRRSGGGWQTMEGVPLSGLPESDFDVLFFDILDTVERESKAQEVADG